MPSASHTTAHDGFVWTTEAWGPALRSSALGEVADHFFTTRQLQLRGDGEAEDWCRVAKTIGVPPQRLLRLTQVHGRAVFVHRNGGAEADGQSIPACGEAAGTPDDVGWPAADILMTDDPAVALAIQVADCVPLLLADPLTGAVAAVHAGWRGTGAGAAIAAVEALGREFGVRPAQLVVAMGPGIGPCCYAVGDELVGAYRDGGFGRHIDRWFIRDDAGGLKLDVWAANRDQLIASGVPAASIHAANLCTADRPDLFASYRRDGPGTGRIAAVIRSRGAVGRRPQAPGSRP
jgi:YfiH family protein